MDEERVFSKNLPNKSSAARMLQHLSNNPITPTNHSFPKNQLHTRTAPSLKKVQLNCNRVRVKFQELLHFMGIMEVLIKHHKTISSSISTKDMETLEEESHSSVLIHKCNQFSSTTLLYSPDIHTLPSNNK